MSKEMKLGGKSMDYQEVLDLFGSGMPTDPNSQVILTNDEINRARKNKRKARETDKTFLNTPIYRTYHGTMRLLVDIVRLTPRKYVKLTDIIIQNFAEVIRWTAAAYGHNDKLFKHTAMEEAIALMYVVRISINSISNLVGEKKHKQLVASFDAVTRQLVAWRGSIKQSEGSDE